MLTEPNSAGAASSASCGLAEGSGSAGSDSCCPAECPGSAGSDVDASIAHATDDSDAPDASASVAHAAAYSAGPDASALLDAAEDAAVTLAGIAEILAMRTAGDSDDLLEALVLAADFQARSLRRALCG